LEKSAEKSWTLKTDIVKKLNGMYFLIIINKIRRFLEVNRKHINETIIKITPIIKVN
jgi:hypothetical protein